MLKFTYVILFTVFSSNSFAQDYCNEFVPWYVSKSDEIYSINRINSKEICLESTYNEWVCGSSKYILKFNPVTKDGVEFVLVQTEDGAQTPFVECTFLNNEQST